MCNNWVPWKGESPQYAGVSYSVVIPAVKIPGIELTCVGSARETGSIKATHSNCAHAMWMVMVSGEECGEPRNNARWSLFAAIRKWSLFPAIRKPSVAVKAVTVSAEVVYVCFVRRRVDKVHATSDAIGLDRIRMEPKALLLG